MTLDWRDALAKTLHEEDQDYGYIRLFCLTEVLDWSRGRTDAQLEE
jgi:hypothetical protein